MVGDEFALRGGLDVADGGAKKKDVLDKGEVFLGWDEGLGFAWGFELQVDDDLL